MLSFFPRNVLGEILNLIESVSEGFPTYSDTVTDHDDNEIDDHVTQMRCFGDVTMITNIKKSKQTMRLSLTKGILV